jgi:hypothetical protein
MCRTLGVEPTQSWREWQDTPPEESLLIVLGSFRQLPVNDLEQYVRDGGAVLLASDRGDQELTRMRGLLLVPGPLQTFQRDAVLNDFPDCPVVNDISDDHPVTRGVLSIATNRPGALVVVKSRLGLTPWDQLATFPPLHGHFRQFRQELATGPACLVAKESSAGGRIVVSPDQSMFANQMLMYEDNAQLAVNTIRWLAGQNRTIALLLDDQQAVAPAQLEQVQVEIPPPTPEEVREALRNLPPEVLISFANSATAVIEDEGIPNDFLTYLVRQIPEHVYQRILMIMATLALGVVAVRKLFGAAAPSV